LILVERIIGEVMFQLKLWDLNIQPLVVGNIGASSTNFLVNVGPGQVSVRKPDCWWMSNARMNLLNPSANNQLHGSFFYKPYLTIHLQIQQVLQNLLWR
jgi:hypothetical protein